MVIYLNNELEVFEEDDYFFRSPRFRTIIEREKMVIDSPPGEQKEDDTPAYLTIGPQITMGMSSMLSLMNTFNNIQ